METGYLDRLLRPRSIAVIGGGVWGESVIKNCRALGFDGLIWPVHPTKAEIAGEVAFTSVEDLPAAPDTALVVVNRYLTIDAVAALSALGCGGAICLASGFSEAQAEEETASALQDMLLQASGDMPLIGPNCYGLVSYLDGFALWPDQHGAERVDSGVAVIAQSSNVALNITMSQGGLPLAYVATTGNQAQIGLSGLGAAMLEDPRVTALGMYIEGIDDLRGFEALATRSRALGKPVVVVKAGRSALAKEATISHTASLAGSDAGARALLKRLGFAQVDSLPKMLETLKLLHVCGPLTSNRIASMSCSGGEASLIADAAEGYDVSFPALNSRQYVDLRKALGPMVALHNPLDYNTYIWRDTEALTQTFSAMLDKDLGLACVILDYPRHDRCNAQDWACVIDAIKAARATGTTPMAVVTTLHDTIS
ncbi:MAG: CoA-binding protein, partial [Pseudoruegeria sp.]